MDVAGGQVAAVSGGRGGVLPASYCGVAAAGHVVPNELEELVVADEAGLAQIDSLEDIDEVFASRLEAQERKGSIHEQHKVVHTE